jgi:hypothetical protein
MAYGWLHKDGKITAEPVVNRSPAAFLPRSNMNERHSKSFAAGEFSL